MLHLPVLQLIVRNLKLSILSWVGRLAIYIAFEIVVTKLATRFV